AGGNIPSPRGYRLSGEHHHGVEVLRVKVPALVDTGSGEHHHGVGGAEGGSRPRGYRLSGEHHHGVGGSGGEGSSPFDTGSQVSTITELEVLGVKVPALVVSGSQVPALLDTDFRYHHHGVGGAGCEDSSPCRYRLSGEHHHVGGAGGGRFQPLWISRLPGLAPSQRAFLKTSSPRGYRPSGEQHHGVGGWG
ncbi:hypothetical protein RRG08_053685, partial [Elysia crispata]